MLDKLFLAHKPFFTYKKNKEFQGKGTFNISIVKDVHTVVQNRLGELVPPSPYTQEHHGLYVAFCLDDGAPVQFDKDQAIYRCYDTANRIEIKSLARKAGLDKNASLYLDKIEFYEPVPGAISPDSPKLALLLLLKFSNSAKHRDGAAAADAAAAGAGSRSKGGTSQDYQAAAALASISAGGGNTPATGAPSAATAAAVDQQREKRPQRSASGQRGATESKRMKTSTDTEAELKRLKDTEAELTAAQAKLADTEAELAAAQAKLADTEAKLADTEAELKRLKEQPSQQQQAYRVRPDTENMRLADALRELAAVQAETEDMKMQVNEALASVKEKDARIQELERKASGAEVLVHKLHKLASTAEQLGV